MSSEPLAEPMMTVVQALPAADTDSEMLYQNAWVSSTPGIRARAVGLSSRAALGIFITVSICRGGRNDALQRLGGALDDD